jgi:hypothetical protein
MSNQHERREGFSLPFGILQLALMAVVVYLWASPVLQPVKLMVVLFHEMSHGLMAIVTGGKVLSILITADEGGACETEGGSAAVIVSAGYLGSMFLGGLILCLSRHRSSVPVVYGMLTLILVSAVATVLRDPYSRTFASALAAAFIFLGFLLPSLLGAVLLRVLGTFCCVYSLADIYSDVLAGGGEDAVRNDALAFSELTGVSVEAVGTAWMAMALVYFLLVLKSSLKQLPSPPRGRGRGAAAATA